jgi:hypothetical protein
MPSSLVSKYQCFSGTFYLLLLASLFYSDDDSRFFWNIGTSLLIDVILQPRGPTYDITVLLSYNMSENCVY